MPFQPYITSYNINITRFVGIADSNVVVSTVIVGSPVVVLSAVLVGFIVVSSVAVVSAVVVVIPIILDHNLIFTMAYQGSERPWFNSSLGTLPFPPLHLPFPSPFPPLPQFSSSPWREAAQTIQLGGLGSAVSSLSGVWGGAPDEIELGAF